MQKNIHHPAKKTCTKCPPCSAKNKKAGKCECISSCHTEPAWDEVSSYDCSTIETISCVTGTETYACNKTIEATCPKMCTDYCNDTETYTYNKTCETAACGSKTCWHK